MIKFLIKKTLYFIAILYGVATTSFFLMYVLPGDPAKLMLGQRADVKSIEAIRKDLGLDKPIYERYLSFLFNAAQGDLGKSYATNRDVLETILERFPATALLAISSMTLASILGIMIGTISALHRGTFLDSTINVIALLGISVPSFFSALMAAWIFGYILDWFPITGYIVDFSGQYDWNHLVLPMVTLAIRPLSINSRLTRSAMIDVLSQDYVRTAYAKGLPKHLVIIRHALPNALNPVITSISTWLASLLAGTFFVEFIFSWPGIGLLAIDAIQKIDFPLIQGVVLFTAVIFIAVSFIVDIIYTLLDPKVSLE